MYKLIIIDDELGYLETLASLFDWASMDFELAETFSSSEKAVSYLESNHVDAILTDVKMPIFSGLDIAKICYEKYPHIKIAFLTAYSDFEYAKNAIKYNVIDYILKATSFTELAASLENFLLSVAASAEQEPVQSIAENPEQFKKQELFSNLLLGMIHSKDELKNQLASVGLNDVNPDAPCCLFTFILDDFNNRLKQWKHSREQLYLAIEQMVLSKNSSIAFFITRYAHDKLEFIALQKNNCTDFSRILDEKLTELTENAKSLLKLDIRVISRMDFDAMTELINCDEINPDMNLRTQDIILAKAHRYIQENYNRNISLNEIAAYVALSPTYFSAYYKKVSKSNFNTDLNKYRIEKAKELLTDANTKASHVFYTVGYQSYTYFYKLFKKYTGMTPASYQAKYSKKK